MSKQSIEAALTPNQASKTAYTGITQTEKVTIWLDDGTAVEKEVTFYISWDSISALLGRIRERVGL